MTKANQNDKQNSIAASIASMIGSASYKPNQSNKKRAKKTKTQQIFVILSIVSFLGSAVFGMAQTYSAGMNQSSQSQAETAEAVAEQTKLQAEIRGYELVLKREPNNSVVLEGLANTYLQMNDYKGAIDPLEKLVKLNPERSDYANLLAQTKQKAGNL